MRSTPGGIRENEKNISGLIDSLGLAGDSIARPRLLERIEALTLSNREIVQQLRMLEESAGDGALSVAQFSLLVKKLSRFRQFPKELSAEEKRSILRGCIQRVVWDGRTAHVIFSGTETLPSPRKRIATLYFQTCPGDRIANEILMYFRSQKKTSQDVSLSDYIETGTDGAPLQLMDVVCEDGDLMEQLANRESARQLHKAVDTCLTDQERLVIRLRYGLDGKPPCRQREVAEVTGISRSYVSRIEKRALQKLRAALEE